MDNRAVSGRQVGLPGRAAGGHVRERSRRIVGDGRPRPTPAGLNEPTRCSVPSSDSRSSTAARPPCAPSTPCASSTTSATTPIRVIALYTETERHALFVRAGRRAPLPRPATTRTARAPQRLPRLRAARARAGRDAGRRRVGRLGLRRRASRLRRAVRAAGHRLRRARAGVMRALGDKIEAKQLAEQAGVPVAPWSGGPVDERRGGGRVTRAARLPADDQGGRGRRRARHAPRRRRRTSWPTRSSARAPRRSRRSATRAC